jgi:hypothetical protein
LEKILENEEDAKKIEESFKRIDEYTKIFEVRVAIYELIAVADAISLSLKSC